MHGESLKPAREHQFTDSSILTDVHTHKHTQAQRNSQTRKHTDKQTNKQTNKQASKRANEQHACVHRNTRGCMHNTNREFLMMYIKCNETKCRSHRYCVVSAHQYQACTENCQQGAVIFQRISVDECVSVTRWFQSSS